MTKFKDTTKGGHRILWREEIKEGERKGWSVGEILMDHGHRIIRAWTPDGEAYRGIPEMDLVPAEPEITHSGWINVYQNGTGCFHTSRAEAEEFTKLGGKLLGRLRVDYYDNGTFTVTKEEV